MAKKKRKPATIDVNDVIRQRTWRRNLPLLLGIFGSYLLLMPTIRAEAAAGTIRPDGSWTYLGYGVATLAIGLLLAARFWRFSFSSRPDKRWAIWLFTLVDWSTWLVTGAGIGLLLMAGVNLVFALT